MNLHKQKKTQKISNKKQTIIKLTQIKTNRKIKNQNNKIHSQQSNQYVLPTRRESQNTIEISNKKYSHIGINPLNAELNPICHLLVLLGDLTFIGSCIVSIFQYTILYIQQDATLHSLFVSGNCSTYFGWYFHPSSGAQTTVSTASGICHTVIAICRYRGRVGTGLSVLWVAYATHNTLKPV